MSDRIPGSSWDNPIWHRGWRISVNSYDGPGAHMVAYGFSHDDFDGAPDANDGRYGYAQTIDAAKAEIDSREDEQ